MEKEELMREMREIKDADESISIEEEKRVKK